MILHTLGSTTIGNISLSFWSLVHAGAWSIEYFVTSVLLSHFEMLIRNSASRKIWHSIVYSVRGKQDTSAAFTLPLQKNGVKQSFSVTGRPHDDAVAETFFATFKREKVYRRAKLFQKRWAIYPILQWGSSASNTEIPDNAGFWRGVLCQFYQKKMFK